MITFKMAKLTPIIFVILLLQNSPVFGANILFFFGVSTYSHRLLAEPFAKSLANRGHNVTILSPYIPAKQSKDPKIHEFSPVALQEFFKDAFGTRSDFLGIRLNSGHQAAWHQMLPVMATTVCSIILESQESQEWIQESKFDLVVIDALFNDCGLGLAWKFNAPHIIFGTCTLFMWQPDAYGFPAETNWIPDASMDFPMEMGFLQRVSNNLRPILWHLYRSYIMYPKLEEMFKLAFKTEEMPPLIDIQRNASLVLQNVHYTLDYPRALPPLVVPVGGLHLSEKNDKDLLTLPMDMQKFLNSSGDGGFIYVSFGSVVQISKMPLEMRQTFISTFGSYEGKLRFLWKFEMPPEVHVELPKNIFAASWMPQQIILQHPKIKGFVTHGGILSIEESVQHRVPMLVMPVFADQEFNSENIVRRGLGLRVHFKDVTETNLKSAIDQLIQNPGYKERVTEVSKIFLDRPIAPLEEAVWWTEHILRYPSSGKYRQSWSSNQNWMVRRSLDVWAFVGGIGILSFLFVFYLIKGIFRLFCTRRRRSGDDGREERILVTPATPPCTPVTPNNNNRWSFGNVQDDGTLARSPSPIVSQEKKKRN